MAKFAEWVVSHGCSDRRQVDRRRTVAANDPIRSVRAAPAVVFRNAITADGSLGFKAEPGR